MAFLCYIVIFSSVVQPGVTFPALDTYRVYFIMVMLLLIMYLFRSGGNEKQSIRLQQNKYIYGIIAAYTLSEAQYFWIGGTIDVFLFWFKKGIVFFLVINIVDSEKKLRGAIWSLVFAVTYLTYCGWEMYLYSPFLLENKGRFQAVGNYNLSNSYALLAAVIWPMAFALMEAENSLFKKTLLMIFLVGVFVSCLYTKSRGGILGMTSGILFSILFSKKINSKFFKTILVGAIVLLVAVYGVMLIMTRSDVASVAGGDASVTDRFMAWVAAIKMFLSHPLFGIGWDHFKEESLNYGMDKRLLAHNTMLSVLAETGIFGFVCFIKIIHLTITQLVKIIQSMKDDYDNDLYLISQGILISFASFIINTSFSVKDHDPIYWAILGLAGAACGIYYKNNKEHAFGEV